jgi:hypothetical protein
MDATEMDATDGEGPDPSAVTIDELVIADEPERWAALGFKIADGCCQLARIRVRFAGRAAGRGILSWSLRAITGVDLDGLLTSHSESSIPVTAPAHPNGVLGIDHVVVMSPALDRSVHVLQAAGLDLRRIREQPTPAGAPRQAFFRLGEAILEVVQEPDGVVETAAGSDGAGPDGAGPDGAGSDGAGPDGAGSDAAGPDAAGSDAAGPDAAGPERPARLWGLALKVEDLERTVKDLGEHAGSIRPAVQEGRRIATLRRSAGLALPIALMDGRAR